MKKIIPGILATAMSFACLAGCGELNNGGSQKVDMSGVKEYVDLFYASQHTETDGDYTLKNSAFYDGKTYSLQWSVNDVEGVTLVVSEDGTETVVDVNEVTPVEIAYVLSVKISDGKGNSTTTSFNRTVLACDPYVLAPITATPVEGTIYKLWVFQGATGQNCYVNGNMKNTYYFETVEDPDKALDLYVEFKEGSTTEFYLYYNKEVKAEEEEGTTATEATEEENTETAETVKTYITLFQSGTHTNAKYWTLEEIRKETNDAAAMPVAYVYNADYGTITTEFGGATWYFGCDGTYTTVDPQKDTGSGYYKGYLTTLTDRATITTDRKFESEKNNFNFAPVYVDAQDIDVTLRGSTYPDVKISWEVTGDGASFEGTTISLKAGEATSEIKVKATFTVGSGENKETSEKEWTFKLIPNTAEAIFAALADLENGQKFGNSSASMTGVITKIDTPFDDQYGNITFTMAVGENSIYCYRVKGSGADELQVGDTVMVAGGMEIYNNKPQFSSGCALIEYTFGPDHNFNPVEPAELPADGATITIAQALAIDTTKLTGQKYYTVGVIKNVYNTQYGNMYIQDADGNELCLYGTFSADGSTRYDAMDVKPVAGDTIKVYGSLTAYNGKNQYKDAWIVEHTPAGTTDPEPEEPAELPADGATITIAQALAIDTTKLTGQKYYTVGVIKNVYNTQYGNMYIQDADGNELCLYGTFSADGSTRYDAMAVKPVAGDTIKVYGSLTAYNGTNQYKDAWIVEHTPAGTTDPEPEEPETQAPAADSVLTIPQANEYASTFTKDNYSEGKYYVVGTIVVISNATYGNMTIKDADGNMLTVYGSFSADGSTQYGNMEVKPVAGDTIKVYGVLGYHYAPQMKDAWIVEHTPNTAPSTPAAELPEENVAYLLSVSVNGTTYYGNEPNSSKTRIYTSTEGGISFYFEKAANEGEYYIYFMDGETKTYISYVGSSTGLTVSTTKPSDTWKIDATNLYIYSTAVPGRYLGCASDGSYFRAYQDLATYSAVWYTKA